MKKIIYENPSIEVLKLDDPIVMSNITGPAEDDPLGSDIFI